MKPIKQYFSLKASFLSPEVDFGGGAEAKIILFYAIWSYCISN